MNRLKGMSPKVLTLHLRRMYCLAGAQFTKNELEAAWLMIEKLQGKWITDGSEPSEPGIYYVKFHTPEEADGGIVYIRESNHTGLFHLSIDEEDGIVGAGEFDEEWEHVVAWWSLPMPESPRS